MGQEKNRTLDFEINKEIADTCKILLIATDEDKNKDTASFKVIQDTIKITDYSIISQKCPEGDPGSIMLQNNSQSNPVYSIDGSYYYSTTEIENIMPGKDTVFMKDNKGCKDTLVFTMPEAIEDTIEIIINSIQDASCSGLNDGTISLTSNSPGIATYSIDGITYSGSGFFNDLNPGVQNIYMKDSYGCKDTSSVTIGEPRLNTTVNFDSTAQCYNDSASISISILDGEADYTIRFSNGIEDTESSGLNLIYKVAAGDYKIYLSDKNNCSDTIELNIKEPEYPKINSITETKVNSDSLKIVFSISEGRKPYTINATDNKFFYSYSQDTVLYITESGSYDVSITDMNGCLTDTTLNLEVSVNLTYSSLTGVHPNPASNKVKVESNLKINRYELLNNNGKIVKNGIANNKNFTINISEISTGIYYLYLYSGNKNIIKKLIIK